MGGVSGYLFMLTSILRVFVKKLVKESFYRKKNIYINVLIVFFVFYKSDVKIFLK